MNVVGGIMLVVARGINVERMGGLFVSSIKGITDFADNSLISLVVTGLLFGVTFVYILATFGLKVILGWSGVVCGILTFRWILNKL